MGVGVFRNAVAIGLGGIDVVGHFAQEFPLIVPQEVIECPLPVRIEYVIGSSRVADVVVRKRPQTSAG